MADTQPVSPVAHGTAVFAGVLMIILGLGGFPGLIGLRRPS